MDNLRTPSELSLQGNVAENWRRWKQRFQLYMEASEKNGKDDKLKVATLLNLIGEDALEVFNTYTLTDAQMKDYTYVMKLFDDYCEPKRNIVFERFKFFSACQSESDCIDAFVTDLKKLASTCEFGDQTDSLIRDRIVLGINNKALQERLLKESDLKLNKAIEICKAEELSRMQFKVMQGQNNVNVHSVKKGEKDKRMNNKVKYNKKSSEFGEKIIENCRRCGKTHKIRQCPAWGKRCMKCKKENHFASLCQNQHIKAINLKEDESDSEILWSISENKPPKQINAVEWTECLEVNNMKISFKLDSGAEVNVLPIDLIKKMENVDIVPTDRKLSSYSGHEVKIKGICMLNCKVRNIKKKLEFFVAERSVQPVLGINALEKLSLVSRICSSIRSLPIKNAAEDIIQNYEDVFKGTGKLKTVHKIVLKEDSNPRVFSSRKIPLSLRDKVKEELKSMVVRGIIERTEEPTEWVHPIVVAQKSDGAVRICMDPRELNKVIRRPHFQMPTQETIFSELQGAKIFTVMDASTAFWQIPLDRKSSKLCTIATPFGRYSFKRLPYGLNSASEVFGKAIYDALCGLEGVVNYLDDILVFGRNMEEHNGRLKKVLERLRDNGIKLSKNKLQLAVKKAKYLGHVLTDEGIQIEDKKIDAITKLNSPKDRAEVQRFIGMVTYLAKFIPNFSERTMPLRRLLSTKTKWSWGKTEQDCFDLLKLLITEAPVLAYFDKSKNVLLSTDASQHGLGAVLLQEGKVISYASTSLNATQQRYAQIEKELLAVVFGCEKFHYYLWGIDCQGETDHRPLLKIMEKPLQDLSPRLQRMVMRLLRYRIKLKYTPGKHMYIADYLSRDPLQNEYKTEYLEGHTETVHSLLCMTDEKTERLKEETNKDTVLQELRHLIKNGWSNYKADVSDEVKGFWHCKEELHEREGIVYRGNKIIIPESLRKEILKLIHTAHQGILTCKNKARSIVYWPGLMQQIEDEVLKCSTCQAYSRSNSSEVIQAHDIPLLPWYKIATDFMCISKENYITVADYHSKFIEIRKLKDKTESSTIGALKSIFRTHGIPKIVVSDNGPPYSSRAFQKFSKEYGFKHVTSSPYYPKSNGQAERSIQTMKGLILKAINSNRDPNLAVLEHNNSPKQNLPAPSCLLMGRKLRTTSTLTMEELKPNFKTPKLNEMLEKSQEIYSNKYNNRRKDLYPGQKVLLQEGHRNWVPAKVIAQDPNPRSYIVQTPDGKQCRRNRQHLRERMMDENYQQPHNQLSTTPETREDEDTPKTKQGLKSTLPNHPEQEPTDNSEQTMSTTPIKTSRSGRMIKTPIRFKD